MAFLLCLLSALIAPFSASASTNEIDIKRSQIKLQWFDTDGHQVEVNWKATAKLIWKEEAKKVEPWLQLWIEAPSQFKIAGSSDPLVKILESSLKSEEGGGQIIILETQSPQSNLKLRTLNGTGSDETKTVKDVGLSVALIAEQPHIALHDSCKRNKIDIKPISSRSSFLFIAASCAKSKKDLDVTVTVSEDATFLTAKGELKKQIRVAASKNSVEVFAVYNKKETLKESPIAEFGINYDKAEPVPAPAKTEVERPASQLATAAPSSTATSGTFKKGLEIGFSYLNYGYLRAPEDEAQPNEFGARARGLFEWKPKDSTHYFKADVELPLFALQPDFFGMPASGPYRISARPMLNALNGSSFSMDIGPGLALQYLRLDRRMNDSAFMIQPSLNLSLKENRTYEWNFAIAPVDTIGGARGRAPFFNGVELLSDFIFTNSRGTSFDFTIQHLNFQGGNHERIAATRLSIGVLLWY